MFRGLSCLLLQVIDTEVIEITGISNKLAAFRSRFRNEDFKVNVAVNFTSKFRPDKHVNYTRFSDEFFCPGFLLYRYFFVSLARQ
jgi:hypothetical protein